MHKPDLDLVEACQKLVGVAKDDASAHGEQPQALASLHGLCDWVTSCINKDGEGSLELTKIIHRRDETGDDVIYEAVKAIATGTPRPGHRVVGVGTYRDGKVGWEALAKEFATTQAKLAEEAELYRSMGGELVAVEYLADRSEKYLKSAGGAMARFFFL